MSKSVISHGDRVAAGCYEFHSWFPAAVNYVSGDSFVSIVRPRVGAGPSNIVISDEDFEGVPSGAGSGLKVSDGGAVIGSRDFLLPPALRYDSRIPAGQDGAAKPPRALLEARLGLLRRILLEEAPAKSLAFLFDGGRISDFREGFERQVAERIREGASLLSSGAFAEGAAKVAGVGFGLTPAGDDLLAGMLAGLGMAGVPFDAAELLGATGSRRGLSGHFLGCAIEGRLFEAARELIVALIGLQDDAGRLRERARQVMKHGETSGADWLAGFSMGAAWAVR